MSNSLARAPGDIKEAAKEARHLLIRITGGAWTSSFFDDCRFLEDTLRVELDEFERLPPRLICNCSDFRDRNSRETQ